MILSCNFEELRALASGADLVLAEDPRSAGSSVVAPAEARTHVSLLRPRLTGDLSIGTLAEQRTVRSAVALISEGLHERLGETVLAHHPAHEEAVLLYFDYAHTIAILSRLDAMGAEMTAMIEVVTGTAPSPESARTFEFPD